LVGEVAKKLNGDNDVDTIYSNLLERFGVKFDMIKILKEACDDFIKLSQFRFIRKVTTITENNKEMSVLQCFYGSSTYTKKEMSYLIEGILHMASECGLDLIYWKSMFE
jgi:hypothetical protein